MTSILETVDPAGTIGTIDELIDRFSGRVEKARKRWNLTTARGFAQAVLAIALGLRGGEKKQVKQWRPSFSRAIRKNWPELSLADREAALREIDGLVQALGVQVGDSQNIVLDGFAEKVYSDARVSAIKRFGLEIAPSFTRVDFKAMESIVDLNVNFIRQREGAISEAYSVEARDIVSKGVAQGLGRRDISKSLATRFGDMRKPSYWDFISSHYVATGRTDSSLTAYSDAGVSTFRFSAVLDERTTPVCFVGSTPVTTLGGPIPIREVKPGMRVLTGSGEYHRVNAVSCRPAMTWRRIGLSSGYQLIVTPDHPIMTETGMREAKTLRAGDRLVKVRTNPGMRNMRGGIPVRSARGSGRKVLLASMLLGFEARGMGQAEVRALQKELRGAESLRGTGPISLLQQPMSNTRGPKRSHETAANAGMCCLQEEVQHQTNRTPFRQGQAALFSKLSEAAKHPRMRILWEGIRGCGRRKICTEELLAELLPQITGCNDSRAPDRGDSQGIWDRISDRGTAGSLLHRLRLAEAEHCNRVQRRLLAYEQAQGKTRDEKTSSDSETRLETFDLNVEKYKEGSSTNDSPSYLQNFPERLIIVSNEEIRRSQLSYNLEVGCDPTYFAGGVLVHNCRMMDGKVFSVADTQAMLAGARAAAEEDPNSIKETNPFVYGKTDKGGEFLQARQPDGKTTQVARVERSGVGTVDDRGKFTQTLSSSALLGKGIGPPPLHPFCRSAIVPLL